ncbi:MAG: PTS sugar transporter subunit IIC [Tissierellales bacterium]|jgi:PTS system mannose-specific IIC component|nr:PTS sugar transporter subunit IIC [Tissierellales bacterium]
MLIQAILIGIFCYLGSLSCPWVFGLTGGWYTLTRPLVSGLIVGLILGDVTSGIMIGVAVQAVYIAMVTPGGVMPADLNFVAYPAIALGILSKADPEVAVTIAATIGILGTIIFNAMMVLNSFWNHRCVSAVEKGDIKGIYKNQVIYPQITNFLMRFIPTVIAVYFGAQYVQGWIDATPELVIHIMNVLGGILPAVGIAILLKQIVKGGTDFVFFLVGFVFIVFLKVNMIALAIIGALLALIHFKYTPSQEEVF